VLRSWIRLGVERRSLTIPDYLVWAAWLSTLGWFTCSVYALRLQIDHPLVEPDLTTDSVEYLTVCKVEKKPASGIADETFASRQSSSRLISSTLGYTFLKLL
jgi:hypothetical protein